jgi:prophage antirepressor-like protein
LDNLQIFKSPEFGQVRTVIINEEPYFVGKDVAEALGYQKPQNALSTHVDEDDSLKQGITDSVGRNQEMTVINESGLYSLILGSKLPSAKRFKKWVTSEVLPSIRKTGTYQKPLSEKEMLRIQLGMIDDVAERVDAVDHDLQTFKQDMPLLALELEKITKVVKKAGVNCLGGKNSDAYKDSSLRGRVYRDIYNQLYREFGVDTSKAIKRNQCELAIQVVNAYKLPLALENEINNANAQLCI